MKCQLFNRLGMNRLGFGHVMGCSLMRQLVYAGAAGRGGHFQKGREN
jgi:hypothetical protein